MISPLLPSRFCVAAIVLFLSTSQTGCARDLVKLHIGGLFPISGTGGWQGGQGCLPAVMMGLDDVNGAQKILKGYELILHWNDSEVRVNEFGTLND